MDFNINRRFLISFWIGIMMPLCVYLLLLHVVQENKLKDGEPNHNAVVSMYLRETTNDKRKYENHVLRYGNSDDAKPTPDPEEEKHHEAIHTIHDEQQLNMRQDQHLLNNVSDHDLLNNDQEVQTVNRNPVEAGVDKVHRAKTIHEKCRLYPDIIIIGFEKCGTVTLRSFLKTHPEIFTTDKPSIPYFNSVKSEVYQTFETFTKYMPCTQQGKMKLDKLSPFGLAEKTFETLQNVKLLAIVREPVERALSHYLHLVALHKEIPSNKFDDIIDTLLDGRINDKEGDLLSKIFRYSKFIDRLRPWLQIFGRGKIHIVDGDNFVKNPVIELNKIETFLNISSYFTDDQFIYNKEKKFYCLKKTGCMGREKGRPHPYITDITRKRLQAYFKPLNEELFHALGQRFSWNY